MTDDDESTRVHSLHSTQKLCCLSRPGRQPRPAHRRPHPTSSPSSSSCTSCPSYSPLNPSHPSRALAAVRRRHQEVGQRRQEGQWPQGAGTRLAAGKRRGEGKRRAGDSRAADMGSQGAADRPRAVRQAEGDNHRGEGRGRGRRRAVEDGPEAVRRAQQGLPLVRQAAGGRRRGQRRVAAADTDTQGAGMDSKGRDKRRGRRARVQRRPAQGQRAPGPRRQSRRR